jgi:hypothetical protein
VHRLVGVHVLDVALGHQSQRLRAVRSAALGKRRDGGYLPGGAGPAGKTALFDDAQQTGRILRWPRPKSALLAAGIQAVYLYERLGGWRRMVSLRVPAWRNALGGP